MTRTARSSASRAVHSERIAPSRKRVLVTQRTSMPRTPAASAARTSSSPKPVTTTASRTPAAARPSSSRTQEASPGDLDQTLRRAARRAEETLADAGGEDDGGHAVGASSASPSAARKRVKSPRESAPMFATRNASLANAPWPS